jgi:heparan-alpha-glucosaminide N-acetyltransferase
MAHLPLNIDAQDLLPELPALELPEPTAAPMTTQDSPPTAPSSLQAQALPAVVEIPAVLEPLPETQPSESSPVSQVEESPAEQPATKERAEADAADLAAPPLAAENYSPPAVELPVAAVEGEAEPASIQELSVTDAAPVLLTAGMSQVSEDVSADALVTAAPARRERMLWLDGYRGLVMFLMISGGFGIKAMAELHPNSFWQQLRPYVEHVEWMGCSPWDLIQPSFMFIVGVAMALSFAKRVEKGHSTLALLDHALWRAVVLTGLGLILATGAKHTQTNFELTNVLAQIGLGYLPLAVFWLTGLRTQILGCVVILVSCWAWFAITPMPLDRVDPAAIQAVKDTMPEGLFGHWAKNVNVAAAFDRWFLNELPRQEVFISHPGGYTTLNFVPALVTMVLGLMAGRLVLSGRSEVKKVGILILTGVLLAVAGWLAGEHLCPLVKRIWTPSWTLFSGGLAFLLMAFFMAVNMVPFVRGLQVPLAVIGTNSLFAYLAAQWSKDWLTQLVTKHLGDDWFTPGYEPIFLACIPLAMIWLLCLWLYRCRAFIRI